MRRGSIPATFDGQSWRTLYVCSGCGSDFAHLELSPDPTDEPHGLPFSLRWCTCGGFLLARSDDYASTDA
jgi:hypothetical protein